MPMLMQHPTPEHLGDRAPHRPEPSGLVQAVAEMAERFHDLLGRLEHPFGERLDGQDDPPDQGVYLVDDVCVVLRLDRHAELVEVFCDVGLPASDGREGAYRTALEMNLRHEFPGARLGVHPESGHLVLSSAAQLAFVAFEDYWISAIGGFAAHVRMLRRSGRLNLAP